MSYGIVWQGEAHPEFEETIRSEVDELLDNGLSSTDDLIFHTVILTPVFSGPSIGVSGIRGSNNILCEYTAETKWVSPSE